MGNSNLSYGNGVFFCIVFFNCSNGNYGDDSTMTITVLVVVLVTLSSSFNNTLIIIIKSYHLMII